MTNKLKQSKQKGFTIIEVMIVLAIAGLIMVVVFLAVPALQRNSRNTAIKSDVSTLMGAINSFSANSNGAFPTTAGGTGAGAWVDTNVTATPNRETARLQGSTVVAPVTTDPTTSTLTATGRIEVRFGRTCNAATGGTNSASTRAAAAYYLIETSSGNRLACTDS